MTVITKELNFETGGEVELVDITDKVTAAVRESRITNGTALVFAVGATGAITTIEYESGLIKDFPAALERLIPKAIEYQHQLKWHDGNGHSHVRASLLGPSLTIPVVNRAPVLGTWQQVIFVELDVRPRSRKVIVQIMGE